MCEKILYNHIVRRLWHHNDKRKMDGTCAKMGQINNLEKSKATRDKGLKNGTVPTNWGTWAPYLKPKKRGKDKISLSFGRSENA